MFIFKYIFWPFQVLFYVGAKAFRRSFQAQKFDREDLFFQRIKYYPLFLFLSYVFLSYLDYILSQDLHWIHEGLATFFYPDWKIDTWFHFSSFFICCNVYFLISLWFINLYKMQEKHKFFLYNWLYIFSSLEFFFSWESLSVYLFQLSFLAPFLYFGYFWTSIFIQWVVDLEEEIEAEEDKKRKAEGRQITWADFTFSLAQFFLGGTEANLGETPKAAMDRYFEEQKIKVVFPPGITTVKQLIWFRRYLYFVIKKIRFGTYFWAIKQPFQYLPTFFKYKLYKKVLAVGPYSTYNPYWNKSLLNRIFQSLKKYEPFPKNVHELYKNIDPFWIKFSENLPLDIIISLKSKKFSLLLFTTKL